MGNAVVIMIAAPIFSPVPVVRVIAVKKSIMPFVMLFQLIVIDKYSF
jgi:hypothetical protein